MSMRGADRPARAPPATDRHGALGSKKAALRPSTAKRTSVCLLLNMSTEAGQQGTFVESTEEWLITGGGVNLLP
jgi:hypothetical protein